MLHYCYMLTIAIQHTQLNYIIIFVYFNCLSVLLFYFILTKYIPDAKSGK